MSSATDLKGKVVAVADGDTLMVLDVKKHQHRIRLAEIDAPEKGQPFGTRAKQLLSELCAGRRAAVRRTGTDRYKRIVGTVSCEGVDANAELVRRGMAWVYVQHARRDSPLFELERQAREAKLGLWAHKNPVPPWSWRRGHRDGETPHVSTPSPGTGGVRGNRRSSVYHLTHCPSYNAVSPGNRIPFSSEQEAVSAGYRRARNCHLQ